LRFKLFVFVIAAATVAALPAAASASAPRGDVLFVQNAESGGFHDGLLTLRGVSRQLDWFTDRPQRDSGSTSFGDFRRALFSGKQSSPNAALDVAGKGLGGVVTLRLSNPNFDPQAGDVTYRVKRLKKASGDLDHYARRLSKEPLPSSFGSASLFIDDATGNYCYTTVVDAIGYQIDSVSSSKWSSDDWSPALPGDFGLPSGQSWSWGSQGGAFRGCSNSATWQTFSGPSSTFNFTTTDPWSGSNTYDCSSSNPAYTCFRTSVDGGTVSWSIGPTP
jgi:hypothetical protein